MYVYFIYLASYRQNVAYPTKKDGGMHAHITHIFYAKEIHETKMSFTNSETTILLSYTTIHLVQQNHLTELNIIKNHCFSSKTALGKLLTYHRNEPSRPRS